MPPPCISALPPTNHRTQCALVLASVQRCCARLLALVAGGALARVFRASPSAPSALAVRPRPCAGLRVAACLCASALLVFRVVCVSRARGLPMHDERRRPGADGRRTRQFLPRRRLSAVLPCCGHARSPFECAAGVRTPRGSGAAGVSHAQPHRLQKQRSLRRLRRTWSHQQSALMHDLAAATRTGAAHGCRRERRRLQTCLARWRRLAGQRDVSPGLPPTVKADAERRP
ncbi:hypothetical protein TRVL_05328 [Trypanosoma vivax]|nr:hypothetical protein TRVL_05328 [Trypanosoma vivax]